MHALPLVLFILQTPTAPTVLHSDRESPILFFHVHPAASLLRAEPAMSTSSAVVLEMELEVEGNNISNNDDGTMANLEPGEASRSQMARLVSPGASTEQLARALWVLSSTTIFVGVNAGLHRPAATESVFARHEPAYYGIVAAILAAVPVEMATAFWLPRYDGRRFHAFAAGLRRVALVLLLLVSAVGGVGLTVKV